MSIEYKHKSVIDGTQVEIEVRGSSKGEYIVSLTMGDRKINMDTRQAHHLSKDIVYAIELATHARCAEEGR